MAARFFRRLTDAIHLQRPGDGALPQGQPNQAADTDGDASHAVTTTSLATMGNQAENESERSQLLARDAEVVLPTAPAAREALSVPDNDGALRKSTMVDITSRPTTSTLATPGVLQVSPAVQRLRARQAADTAEGPDLTQFLAPFSLLDSTDDVEDNWMKRFQSPKTVTPRQLSVEEASRMIAGFSQGIFENHAELQRIVNTYGSSLQKRWLKKSPTQRRQILASVNHDLPESHNEHVRIARIRHKNPAVPAPRGTFLLPQLNLKDPTSSSSMPMLAASRASAHPFSFVASDMKQQIFGVNTGYLVVDLVVGQYAVFQESEGNDEYTVLMPNSTFKDGADICNYANDLSQYPAGDSILLLEAQSYLYYFIVKWCKVLLHDHCTSPNWLEQVGTKRSNLPIAIPTGTSALELLTARGLRLADLDFEPLIRIVEARSDAAWEHARSLREDPGYFKAKVLEWRDNTDKGVTLEGSSKLVHTDSDSVVLASVVCTALADSQLWKSLTYNLKELKKVQDRATDTALSQEQYNKWLHIVLTMCAMWWQGLSLRMLQSYRRGNAEAKEIYGELTTQEIEAMSKRQRKKLGVGLQRRGVFHDRSQKILTYASCFCRRLHSNTIGIEVAVEEMVRLFQEEDEGDHWEGSIVTDWTRDCLADITIITLIMSDFARDSSFNTCKLPAARVQVRDLHPQIYEALIEVRACQTLEDETATLGAPDGDRFQYPVDRPRTQRNVERMRSSEANLDAFWTAFANGIRGSSQLLFGTLRAIERDGLERTPEWVLPEPMPSKQHQSSSTVVPALGLTQDGPGVKPSRLMPVKPRFKVKTRGESQPPEPIDEEPAAEVPGNASPTFQVDRRALRVFEALFHTPSQHRPPPREVAWADLLHAMTSLGFGAENLYGSAWEFTPPVEMNANSITFHAPHPETKFSFRTARRIGRRLSSKYEWEGAMFDEH